MVVLKGLAGPVSPSMVQGTSGMTAVTVQLVVHQSAVRLRVCDTCVCKRWNIFFDSIYFPPLPVEACGCCPHRQRLMRERGGGVGGVQCLAQGHMALLGSNLTLCGDGWASGNACAMGIKHLVALVPHADSLPSITDHLDQRRSQCGSRYLLSTVTCTAGLFPWISLWKPWIVLNFLYAFLCPP